MSSTPESVGAKQLTALRVVDLKQELEKRGLEKTGVKAALIDRLKKALEEEGKDPEQFEVEVTPSSGRKSPARARRELKDGEEEEDEDGEGEVDLIEEIDSLMSGDGAQGDSEDKKSENGVVDLSDLAEEDDVVCLTEVQENKLLTDQVESQPTNTTTTTKAAEASEAKTCANTAAATDSAKDKTEAKVETPQKTQSAAKAVPAVVSESPKKEEAGSKATATATAPSVEKNGVMEETPEVADFDMPLIVHVDDSLNELDSDIVKKQSQTGVKDGSSSTGVDPGQGATQTGTTVAGSGAAVGASGDSTGTPARVDAKTKEGKTDKEDAKKAEVGKGDGAKLSQAETKSTPSKDAKPAAKDSKAVHRVSSARGRNLWVSGLSSTTRATDLKSLFSKYGKVAGAKVVTNARSPGSRCYGFVTMSTPDEAFKCIQHLHRTELHGRMISVERAKNDPASQAKKADLSKKVDAKPSPTPKKPVEKKEATVAVKKTTSTSSSHGTKTTTSPRAAVTKEADRKPRGSSTSSTKKDDILSFEKIRTERQRARLRELERRMREEERRKARDLEREREKQREIERCQKEEAVRLAREKERLRLEKMRLEREKIEAERERIRLERERREQERLAREREEQRRIELLRVEEQRRSSSKRQFDSRGSRDSWSEPAKRPALESSRVNNAAPSSSYPPQQPQQHNRYNSYDQRGPTGSRAAPMADNSSQYDRRVDRYERHEQPASRYTERRDSHESVRRDRDDRRVAETRAPKYDRYEERARGHERHHEPHHSTMRNSPPRHSNNIPSQGHRDRYPDSGFVKDTRGYVSDTRTVAPRDGGSWHTSQQMADSRSKPHVGSYGAGPGSASAPIDWGAPTRVPQVQPSSGRVTDRWQNPMSSGMDTHMRAPHQHGGAGVVSMNAPMMQAPPTNNTFLQSAANIMMGVGLGGRQQPEMRYDAYKNMSGNVRRY